MSEFSIDNLSEIAVDILIIGGGLTGAALSIAVKGLGYSVLMVEKKTFSIQGASHFDARSLALSSASLNILKTLKIWPLLANKASAIDAISISEQGAFGRAFLKKEGHPLGFVCEMQDLNAAFYHCLDKASYLAPAKLLSLDCQKAEAIIEQEDKKYLIKASLIVAADGLHSSVRDFSGLKIIKKDYQQQAIVANIALNRPHAHIAYERFTKNGPLAMLPMQGNRASMVWAMSPSQASAYMALSDKDFLNRLQENFGYKLGRFNNIGQRAVYPLEQAIMPQQIAWPLVFIGNAAHTLHPIAGQGFNLSLRDAASLAQCIGEHGINPLMLSHYQVSRVYDQKSIRYFSHGLLNLFTQDYYGLSLLRSLGLMVFDNSSGLKKILSRYAQGFAATSCSLASGIALSKKEY